MALEIITELDRTTRRERATKSNAGRLLLAAIARCKRSLSNPYATPVREVVVAVDGVVAARVLVHGLRTKSVDVQVTRGGALDRVAPSLLASLLRLMVGLSFGHERVARG